MSLSRGAWRGEGFKLKLHLGRPRILTNARMGRYVICLFVSPFGERM